MSSDEIVEAAIFFAHEMAQQMYDASSLSLVQADKRLKGFDHFEYPHLRPLVMRAALREQLKDEGLPQSWRLGGLPQRMGQLIIDHDDVDIRVLKERRKTIPGGVPVAGHNRARKLVWQPGLDIGHQQRAAIPKTHLLLLWDFINAGRIADGLTLRLVHTVEVGVYGKPVKLDLDLDLSGFAAGTHIIPEKFIPTDPDDDIDFFRAEIDRGENGDSGAEEFGS